MSMRRNSKSIRVRCRDITDLGLQMLQDAEDEEEGLERLNAFRSEIEAARDTLDAILSELDEADELEANARSRTPPIVSRRSS